MRSLDTWCTSTLPQPPTPTASSTQSGGQLSLMMPNGSSKQSRQHSSSNEYDQVPMPPGLDSPISTTSTKVGHGHGHGIISGGSISTTGASVYEPSEVDLSCKTLVYHAIMDTVSRLQIELAVPIAVFI